MHGEHMLSLSPLTGSSSSFFRRHGPYSFPTLYFICNWDFLTREGSRTHHSGMSTDQALQICITWCLGLSRSCPPALDPAERHSRGAMAPAASQAAGLLPLRWPVALCGFVKRAAMFRSIGIFMLTLTQYHLDLLY